MLSYTARGKVGFDFNESKLRGLFKLEYLLKLLQKPHKDNYTSDVNEEQEAFQENVSHFPSQIINYK